MAASVPAPPTPRRSLARRAAFALVPPMILFAAAEAAMRVADYDPERYGPGGGDHYFVEKGGADGGFVRAVPRGARMRPDPDPLFAARKPANGLRIFIIGDSAAMGFPYELGGFSEWLELQLKATLPERRVEIVNAATGGWTAGRALQLLHECLRREPDAVIWMAGQAELAGLADVREALSSNPAAALRRALLHLRVFRALDSALRESAPPPISAPPRGLAACTAAELSEVRERFVSSTRAASAAAAEARVPIVFCTLPRNVRSEPNLSRYGDAVEADPELRRACDAAFAAAQAEWSAGRADKALAALAAAPAGASDAAKFLYLRAQALEKLGRTAEARADYLQAMERDAYPTRALPWMQDVIRAAASAPGAALADLETLFDERSPLRLTGSEWMHDMLHPNLEGHELIAQALLPILEKKLSLAPDRARSVPPAAARDALGITAWRERETKRNDCFRRVRALVEGERPAAEIAAVRALCGELLRARADDGMVNAALGLAEAMAGDAGAGARLERAIAGDGEVADLLLRQLPNDARYAALLRSAGIDAAELERRLVGGAQK